MCLVRGHARCLLYQPPPAQGPFSPPGGSHAGCHPSCEGAQLPMGPRRWGLCPRDRWVRIPVSELEEGVEAAPKGCRQHPGARTQVPFTCPAPVKVNQAESGPTGVLRPRGSWEAWHLPFHLLLVHEQPQRSGSGPDSTGLCFPVCKMELVTLALPASRSTWRVGGMCCKWGHLGRCLGLAPGPRCLQGNLDEAVGIPALWDLVDCWVRAVEHMFLGLHVLGGWKPAGAAPSGDAVSHALTSQWQSL